MVICDTCGQSSSLLFPGVPCLRKYADNTKTCLGTMREENSDQPKMSAAERQALNRIRRKVEGICRQCSEKLAPKSSAFCEKHLKDHREKARQRYKDANDRTRTQES